MTDDQKEGQRLSNNHGNEEALSMAGFSGPDENGPIIEKFCGNNTIPAPRVTPSEQVWVRFRTDRSIVDSGFSVTFQSTCE